MPVVLRQFQADFETRTAATKEVLVALAGIEAECARASVTRAQVFEASAHDIDVDEELIDFVRSHTPDTPTFKPFEVIEYKAGKQSARKRRLPRLPHIGGGSSSESKPVEPEPPENPQFGVPLAQLATPEAPVPPVLTTMLQLMRDRGALTTEGVFRKPGSKTSIDQIRDALERDHPIPDNIDIHELASLLKEWFRSLPEPAVPTANYHAAVAAGEQAEADPSACLAVLDDIEPLHRASLLALFNLLSDMAEPSVVEVTLMSPNNLGVCFGPTLLRSPAANPLEAMANIDAEVAFVRVCIDQLRLRKSGESAAADAASDAPADEPAFEPAPGVPADVAPADVGATLAGLDSTFASESTTSVTTDSELSSGEL
ncbi:uncharacterized protein AMSG_01275 [Thecamonas trahens ATCC 50062]|uniref:Rho-GAP domain-containing protein n=1 Tax=Thecamonas trahens ATCC 50062 TaxID=461836 RepID=A0A0L0DMT9_THETB|nr:hypothetical protein AMSG_01275 [Thecamonas trahens ATCC 50062]KNC53565.1 hypothetical protein AMSG_01275 [Thecamonas trahens ATCC 50062]|eukprot:XP_013761882.1 hypothetical protein AMSG_01275 [Thecamonas trahens ATCC 50062]